MIAGDVGHLQLDREADLLQAVGDRLRHLPATGEEAGHAPERHQRRRFGQAGLGQRRLRSLRVEGVDRFLRRGIERAIGDVGDGDLTRAADQAGDQRLAVDRPGDRLAQRDIGGSSQGAGASCRIQRLTFSKPVVEISSISGVSCRIGRCSGGNAVDRLRLPRQERVEAGLAIRRCTPR